SFARVVRESQSRHANIADYERLLLGVDHAVFGRRLAASWRLPQRVQEVIWLHRQPVEAIPLPSPGRLLVGLVGLADVLARQAEVGFSGNYAFPRPADVIARQLDISREALEDVARELPGRVQPRLDLLDLHAPADEKAYYNALADANAELGRLNLQLRTEAQRLSADARCTQLLGEFHQQFTSAAGVDETLVRIAATLARARDIPLTDETALLAYSVNSETHEMLALLTNGRDVREWQSLPLGHGFSFSRSEASPTPAREVLPTLVADRAELEPWLRGREYVHQPLVAGGNWIGGAMIPGEASDGVGGQASQLLADSLAVPLALVQERCRAMMLSEQLAGSSQLLADTQDQIAEAKTLASVGRMAAGAAHELNNPLAVVSGRAQLMKERAETQADRRTWGLIAEQSEQISDIVTELMEFANPPRPHPEHVRPEELLREAVNSFVSSEHPQAAAAEIDIREEQPLPAVRVDSGQIRAVLLELLGNAATAAPEPRIRLHIRADQLDGAVLVSVVDNGPGMDEQTLRQAYTPFFSLQSAGRRRGLGLPKAKRLVESNGGRIWIRSRVGQGTAVYLELPSAERSVAEEDQRHAYTPRTHRAGGG
ncbi:MAG: ATP-binding protein, partial [Planctomycetota bacterium]